MANLFPLRISNKLDAEMNQVRAFIPSIRIFQAFGLNPFSIDKNFRAKESQAFKIFSLFQIGSSLLLLIGSFYASEVYLDKESLGIADIVDYVQLIGFRVLHLIILIEALLHQKSSINLLECFCEIDGKIAKLNIDKGLELNKNYFSIALTMVFYVGGYLLAFASLMLRKKSCKEVCYSYWTSSFLPYLVSWLRNYQTISFVWFIKKRFEILNEALAKLNLRENPITKPWVETNFSFYTSDLHHLKRFKPMKSFEQLMLFRQMYDKLYVLSTVINYSYGLSNLINTAIGFLSITSNIYFIFLSFSEQHVDVFDVLAKVLLCLPYVVNIVTVSATCHFTILTVSCKFSSSIYFLFFFFYTFSQ